MAVAAIFAALLTEIGVYALIRLFTLIFVHDIGYTDTVIVTLARFTMMTGVVGAIARTFLALLTIAIGLGAQAMLVLCARRRAVDGSKRIYSSRSLPRNLGCNREGGRASV